MSLIVVIFVQFNDIMHDINDYSHENYHYFVSTLSNVVLFSINDILNYIINDTDDIELCHKPNGLLVASKILRFNAFQWLFAHLSGSQILHPSRNLESEANQILGGERLIVIFISHTPRSAMCKKPYDLCAKNGAMTM